MGIKMFGPVGGMVLLIQEVAVPGRLVGNRQIANICKQNCESPTHNGKFRQKSFPDEKIS
jgi:hypothetical protein